MKKIVQWVFRDKKLKASYTLMRSSQITWSFEILD